MKLQGLDNEIEKNASLMSNKNTHIRFSVEVNT